MYLNNKVFIYCCCFVITFNCVQSDEKILFRKGLVRYRKHGKRSEFFNVPYIDGRIINPDNQPMLIIKTKSMPNMFSDSIRNLENLEILSMAYCGIKNIEGNAFANLPKLTALHLHDNLLEEIKNNIFTVAALPALKILTLQRNYIKQIESQAFDNMRNLVQIKLNSNQLRKYDGNWFKNTPNLIDIYLRRNRITSLPANAFRNIIKSEVKLYLSRNQIESINPESFYGLNVLSQLWLDRNNITQLPAGVFRDLVEVDVVYFARNRIHTVSPAAFPKIKKIGIADFSSNFLKCLPLEIVSVTNLTSLDRNRLECRCIEELETFKRKYNQKFHQINYDNETCFT